MKRNPFAHCSRLVAALLVSLSLPALLGAQDPKTPNSQRRFASPDEATQALRQAAEAGDKAAVNEIFGPDVKELLTGDEVQDKANFTGFSQAMAKSCVATPDGDDRVILSIGTNDWTFPIPLIKQDGQWFFDTAAGRDEIVNRHIGRDELSAIGICRAYVKAQVQYASQNGAHKYALKFKSTPGQKDGLYWDSTNGPSPFGALVAEAHAKGYENHPAGTGPHPFHGYLFRILTAQGHAAPGGKLSYLVSGNLTAGFALVAYPDKWNKSGIMTFIVNQDGNVYQRNLGTKTSAVAASMTEYNPDRHWAFVSEPGVSEP